MKPRDSVMNKEVPLNSWEKATMGRGEILFFVVVLFVFLMDTAIANSAHLSLSFSDYSKLLPDDLNYRTVISEPLKLKGLREELGTLKRDFY